MKKLLLATLANAFFVTTFAISTAVATQTDSRKQAQQTSRNYIEFRDSPDACPGQLVNDGLICIAEFQEDQRPFRRMARLAISNSIISFETLSLIEFEPNEANLAFMFVMDRHIRSSLAEPTEKFPVVKAYIRTDGAIGIDSDYGTFPPGFSPEEESASVVERHQTEIQMLISALVETR